MIRGSKPFRRDFTFMFCYKYFFIHVSLIRNVKPDPFRTFWIFLERHGKTGIEIISQWETFQRHKWC